MVCGLMGNKRDRMNSYEVCSRLLSAESEREVNTIIESVQEMSEASNWYPLDDRETNRLWPVKPLLS